MAVTEQPVSVVRPTPQPSRRQPRRLFGRMSSGHVVMILAGLLAVVLNLTALRARDATYPVAVAAHDLRPGQVLGEDAVRVTSLRLDAAILPALLHDADLDAVRGWVLTTSVAAGEPLRHSDLQAPSAPSALRAMSLPVDASRAVGGVLAPGDRVDIIEVRDGVARYLATDVGVLDATRPQSGLGGIGSFSVTLAVDETTALRLAEALHSSTLDIVRSTGASRATAEPHERPATEGDAAPGSGSVPSTGGEADA